MFSNTPDVEINVAEEIAGWYVCYPDAFEAARQRWFAFIYDETADTTDYAEALTDQITMVDEDHDDVPDADKPDVIVAAFWAATADAQLNQRAEQAIDSTNEMRKALNEHTEW